MLRENFHTEAPCTTMYGKVQANMCHTIMEKKPYQNFQALVIFATWVLNNGNEIIVTLTHSHSLVHVYTHHMLDVPCASHYIAREV